MGPRLYEKCPGKQKGDVREGGKTCSRSKLKIALAEAEPSREKGSRRLAPNHVEYGKKAPSKAEEDMEENEKRRRERVFEDKGLPIIEEEQPSTLTLSERPLQGEVKKTNEGREISIKGNHSR